MKAKSGRRTQKGDWSYKRWLTWYFIKRTCKRNRNHVRDLDILGKDMGMLGGDFVLR